MDNKEIDPEFLKKISPVINGKTYPISPPKLSPQDRKQRRLAFRNENVLYKRKSSLSGEPIISFFHEHSPFTVYSQEEWWSDNWDPLDHGMDFDFDKKFFKQFYDLQLKVPRTPLVNNKAENSPYCNFADGNRNCHMITSANWNMDSYYSFCLVSCSDATDCLWCMDSELMYECTDCRKCYNLKFSRHCNNCHDGAFLYDCIGAKNAIFCAGLRNCEYQMFNKPVSKEEFQKISDYYFCGRQERLEEAKKIYTEFLNKIGDLRKTFYISSENVSGNNIFNSKNIYEGYDVYDSQDCAYVHGGLKGRDCYDVCFFDGTELCYESTSLIGYGFRFTNFCRESHNLTCCDSCYGCKDCFGCVGLRNKQYCVFNKQYSKDEYEQLVPRIINKMIESREWGEFFPVNYSLFAYNETLANDYFPLTKEEILKRGWEWREPKQKNYQKPSIEIHDDELLSCEITGKNYKIIPQELKFYKKMKLPIPKKCPEQRQKERMQKRI